MTDVATTRSSHRVREDAADRHRSRKAPPPAELRRNFEMELEIAEAREVEPRRAAPTSEGWKRARDREAEQARDRSAQDSGDDAAQGPGRSLKPAAWPRLWRELEDFLEPLGRALIGELRHGKGVPKKGLPLSTCRALWYHSDGTPARASDILLVATCSTRRCGTRRFNITGDDDDDGIYIAAGPHVGPIPKDARVTRTSGRDRAREAEGAGSRGRGTPKAALDDELDAYHGRPGSSRGPEAKEKRRDAEEEEQRTMTRQEHGPPVFAKTKRPRGGRGNPNRPSQLGRALKLQKFANK